MKESSYMKSMFHSTRGRLLVSSSFFGLIAVVLVTNFFLGRAHTTHAAATSYCKTAIVEYQRRVSVTIHENLISSRKVIYLANVLQVSEAFCYDGNAITEANGTPAADVKAFPGPIWSGVANTSLVQSYQAGETHIKEFYHNSEDGKNTPKGIRFIHVTAHFTGIKFLKAPWISDVKLGVPDWQPDLTIRLRGDGSFDYSPSSGSDDDLIMARATDCTDPALNPTTCKPVSGSQNNAMSMDNHTSSPIDWCTNTTDQNITQGDEDYQFHLLKKGKDDSKGAYAVLYTVNELNYDTGAYSINQGVGDQLCKDPTTPTPTPTPTTPTPTPTPTPGQADVSGTWTGYATQGGNTDNNVKLILTQSGTSVSGTNEDGDDNDIGTITGSFDANTGALSLSASFSNPVCHLQYSLTLSTDGNSLDGTLVADCTGTWQVHLTRS